MSEVVEVRGVLDERCVGNWVYDADGSRESARRYTVAREDSDGFEPIATVGSVPAPGRAVLADVDDAQRRAWRKKHSWREGSTD